MTIKKQSGSLPGLR